MLDQGAFDVLVQGDQTQVRARSGSGLVQSEDRQVTVNGGERVTVKAGLPPELPVPDTLNLVLNGDFEGRISPPWQTFTNLGQADLEPGKVTLEEVGQGQAVRFTRKTEDGAPMRSAWRRTSTGTSRVMIRWCCVSTSSC